VHRGAAALARLDAGVEQGITAAITEVEKQLQVSLRDADPARYVGLVLIDGLHGSEERVSFEPTGKSFMITEADVPNRIVRQLDGRPAAQVYAEAVGSTVDALDSSVFMAHSLGLMIDDQPWIRSPQQVVDGGGMTFYCQILPGMEVDLMRGTDLIGDTRTALRDAVADLGGAASSAVARLPGGCRLCLS